MLTSNLSAGKTQAMSIKWTPVQSLLFPKPGTRVYFKIENEDTIYQGYFKSGFYAMERLFYDVIAYAVRN